MLRIIQEAFTNTLKQAGAKNLSVTLRSSSHQVDIVIEADGCGFDPASTSMGKGLHSMEKRVRSIGAVLKVLSKTTPASHPSRRGGTRTHVVMLLGAPATAPAEDG